MSTPPEPMTTAQRAEIREAARPGHADILAQLIKHGAHDDPKHGKVIVHGVTVVPAAALRAAVRVVWYGVPALLDEVEQLRKELDLAMGPRMYLDVQKILDRALGGGPNDGAGKGLVADVALVADRMAQAEAASAVLQSAADETARRINTALTTAADLHEFNSPEGDHLAGCPGCRLENDLGEARPDPRMEALEGLAARYPAAFEWLLADAKARATRKDPR